MLIDRDRDTRDLLHTLFELHGFTAALTGSNDEATRRLEVETFDLLISGFFVDNLDAQACWRQLDTLRTLGRCPVGVLSGFQIDAARAGEHGLAFALAKPCTATTLLREMSAALQLPALPPERVEVVAEYFRSIERGDYRALAELCTDDVVYHLPRSAPPMPERVVGKAAFAELAEATFRTFKSPRFAIDEVRPLPAGAVVRYASTWIDALEEQHALDGAVLFELAGDKIREIGVRCDLSEIAPLR